MLFKGKDGILLMAVSCTPFLEWRSGGPSDKEGAKTLNFDAHNEV